MQPQDFIGYMIFCDKGSYEAIRTVVKISGKEYIWGQLEAIQEWEDDCQEVEDNQFPQCPLTQAEQHELELICGAIYNLFPPKEV